MSDIALTGEVLPAVTETFERPLSDADLAALRRSVRALEQPGLAARLSAAAGAPLDMIGRSLPAPVTEAVGRSTEAAMRGALRVALKTLPKVAPAAGTAIESVAAKAPGRFGSLFGSSTLNHKALAALSGAVGGAFGLATLAVELPVSTTLMLRSIAEIAREEGEDLEDPEGALACVQVFALGGRSDAASESTGLAESGYFSGARRARQDDGGGRPLRREQDPARPIGARPDPLHRADRRALRHRGLAEGRRPGGAGPRRVRRGGRQHRLHGPFPVHGARSLHHPAPGARLRTGDRACGLRGGEGRRSTSPDASNGSDPYAGSGKNGGPICSATER